MHMLTVLSQSHCDSSMLFIHLYILILNCNQDFILTNGVVCIKQKDTALEFSITEQLGMNLLFFQDCK